MNGVYVLTEEQIKRIIKDRKFDEDKYLPSKSFLTYSLDDVLYEYTVNNHIPLTKDRNMLYKMIDENGDVSDQLYSDINNEMSNIVAKEVNRLIEKINKGDIW
ncbi:MAG: hypothetical protein ACLT40_00935 [Fusobacterium sp.]